MLKRRTAAIFGAAWFLSRPALAQQSGAPPFGLGQNGSIQDDHDTVPNELGHADFAGTFELEQTGAVALVADVPDIPVEVVEALSGVHFRQPQDINRYFVDRFGTSFLGWFNQAVADRSEWTGKVVRAPDAEANFVAYWSQALPEQGIGIFDFLAYMAVFINECDGNLVSVSERFGSASRPGLSYLYDSFRITSANGRVWSKKSYNTRPLNWTVGELARDEFFQRMHAHLPPGETLRGTRDPVWDGTAYPRASMPTSADPNLTGFLQQTDFFKFRGRGLIQTTWRANYRKLVDKVVGYTGDSDIVHEFRNAWARMNADDVCTASTNIDWDRLFSEPSRFLLCNAVRQHAVDGRYLPLSANAFDLNGTRSGSLRFMGDRIGGYGYGLRLKARVRQICRAMS